MQQKEYFGMGSIEHLKDILSQEKPNHIFLVCGKESYRLSGAEEKIIPQLEGYKVTEFADFSSNAKLEDIEKGLKSFRSSYCDLTLAVGGGSSLDLAKAITILAPLPEKPEDYIRNKTAIQPRKVPFIAVPTTAGTGSEATHFATIYIGKTKFSLTHPSLLPNYAIINPGFTFSLSKQTAASTGMDVLAQAMESYWSVLSTEESKRYASEAITLILSNLEKAVCNPDTESKMAVSRAANLSGKAINISFTTACHAISYPITSYFNVPHGHAVALTLPEMILYNSDVSEKDCLDKRGAEYVQKMLEDINYLFGVKSPEEVKKRIELLIDNIGLQRKLSLLGITTDSDLNVILKNGFNPERVKNNPRVLTEDDLRRILMAIRG